MNVKEQLKQGLLEIPVNHGGLREKHRLAVNLDLDFKKVEFYLNELVHLDILIEKKQYICPNCRDTVNIKKELLDEIVDDGYFGCDNCYDFINPEKDVTGYVYYDIKDRELLENW